MENEKEPPRNSHTAQFVNLLDPADIAAAMKMVDLGHKFGVHPTDLCVQMGWGGDDGPFGEDRPYIIEFHTRSGKEQGEMIAHLKKHAINAAYAEDNPASFYFLDIRDLYDSICSAIEKAPSRQTWAQRG